MDDDFMMPITTLKWWEKIIFYFCKRQTTADWGFDPSVAIGWKYSKWLRKTVVMDEYVFYGKRGDRIIGYSNLPKIEDKGE